MDFLTVFQAGTYCGVPAETVADWIDQGIIQTVTTKEGHCRIRLKDLQGFLRRQGLPIPHDFDNLDRKRILVIDDDPIIVETMVTALQEEPYNYEIVSASDGFEAGVQVKQTRPDLVILDIMMPDIDGYEVCRQLKEDEATKRVKVIVLSAYLDDENYEKMKQYGADACFAKPLSLRRLKSQVRQMLGIDAQSANGRAE
jgi:CheY-like chemotaxis protein